MGVDEVGVAMQSLLDRLVGPEVLPLRGGDEGIANVASREVVIQSPGALELRLRRRLVTLVEGEQATTVVRLGSIEQGLRDDVPSTTATGGQHECEQMSCGQAKQNRSHLCSDKP